MNDPKIEALNVSVDDLGTIEGWKNSYPALISQGPAALEPVRRGMSHRNWRIRMWCADFMDHFADQRCIEALVAALDDPIARVRLHALHSLGCQTCKADALKIDVVPLLIDKALNDRSIGVRRAAAHMLGNQSHDQRIAPALKEIAHQHDADAKLKTNASWAIARFSVCPPKRRQAPRN